MGKVKKGTIGGKNFKNAQKMFPNNGMHQVQVYLIGWIHESEVKFPVIMECRETALLVFNWVLDKHQPDFPRGDLNPDKSIHVVGKNHKGQEWTLFMHSVLADALP